MAGKVFKKVSDYDKLIFKWFNEQKDNKIKLRYGEKLNQDVFLIKNSINQFLIIK